MPDLELIANTLDVYGWHRAAAEPKAPSPALVDRLRNLTQSELGKITLRREPAA